jgi:hypothetical protein
MVLFLQWRAAPKFKRLFSGQFAIAPWAACINHAAFDVRQNMTWAGEHHLSKFANTLGAPSPGSFPPGLAGVRDAAGSGAS